MSNSWKVKCGRCKGAETGYLYGGPMAKEVLTKAIQHAHELVDLAASKFWDVDNILGVQYELRGLGAFLVLHFDCNSFLVVSKFVNKYSPAAVATLMPLRHQLSEERRLRREFEERAGSRL